MDAPRDHRATRARRTAFALASAALAAIAAVSAGCLGGPPADGAPSPPTSTTTPPPDLDAVAIALEEAYTGLDQPVLLTHAGDGSGRVFILEQKGVVRVGRAGALEPSPFLDIRDLVGSGGERGLLGLAFAPDFEESRGFFVHYTDKAGDTVVARYRASADGTTGDPSTAAILLQVDQPFANHNGGMIAFGPKDGFLYVALGDGGAAGDPGNRAQDPTELLGKILRLDVAGDGRYAIPPSNPFATTGGADEVWATGLRNPWRFSFDRATGDLWIGDVGQGDVEEIDFEPAGSAGGKNYGWNVWEGSERFRPGATNGDATFPVSEYARADGNCAVTGGYVYRGVAVPALRGVYVFSDYCSGTLWGVAPENGAWETRKLLDTEHFVSSFGEDESGELHVVDHRGRVMRVVAG